MLEILPSAYQASSESKGSVSRSPKFAANVRVHGRRRCRTIKSFPLASLSIELHLRMLQYCIVAPIPIVNPCTPRANQHGIAVSEAAGQELINPGIIFTCKLYAAEGLAIAYASNTFLFTNISSSKYFKPSSRDFYSKIQNLIVRHDILEGRVYRKCIVGTVDWLSHFWSLRVLQIDFRARVWEYYHYIFDELEHNFEQAVSPGHLIVTSHRNGACV